MNIREAEAAGLNSGFLQSWKTWKSLNKKNECPGPGKVLEFCRSLKSLTGQAQIYFHYSCGAKLPVVMQHGAFVGAEQKRQIKRELG